MANKSIDHKLVKITTMSKDAKEAFKTLGIGIICNVSDLVYIIGDPDLLVINKEFVTYTKGAYLVEAKELENY